MSLKELEILGQTARDRVTGFRGVVESVSFDLYGCVQAVVKPPVGEDNKILDGRWFDVNRLEIDDTLARVLPVPDFSQPVDERITERNKGPAEKPANDRF